VAVLQDLLGPAGRAALTGPASTLESTGPLFDRVLTLAGTGQRTELARVALDEGLVHLNQLEQQIEAAVLEERSARSASAEARQRQLTWLSLAAAGLALLAVGLLGPLRTAEPSAGPRPDVEPGPDTATVSEPTPEARQPAQTASEAEAPDEPREKPGDRRRQAEITAAADLCTDFARVAEAGELPSLLERAARLMDATGFIVWVADSAGTVLRPALAHGYAPAALARMPAIPRHDDNATAAAWRDGDIRVVRTNGMTPGALVVPLLGADGCTGVLAAEVRHGRESSETVRALARVVAAQLAMVVSPAGTASGAADAGTGPRMASTRA
jgi:hypothetical protein